MLERSKSMDAKMRLVEAVGNCMRQYPLENITVDQIAKEAGLSRQTFYRHFRDKYDLINWYFDRLLLESFDQMGSGRTVREGLDRKFAFIEEEHLFFFAAFQNDDQNNLKEHDFQMIFDFYKDLIAKKGGVLTPPLSRLLEMYCQSSVYMTVQWVLRKADISAQELTQLMLDAMPDKIRKLFRELGILEEA